MAKARSKQADADAAEAMDIGLSIDKRSQSAKALNETLDGTYSLMVLTHVYHWNVRGPLFGQLHKLLQEQYEALFASVDEIAERIRQLGFDAPVNPGKFPSGIQMPGSLPDEFGMVADLKRRNEAAIRTLRKASSDADEAKDYVTQDLCNKCRAHHEKAAWMLRSHLGT